MYDTSDDGPDTYYKELRPLPNTRTVLEGELNDLGNAGSVLPDTI